MQQKSDQQLEATLDRNSYDDSKLIELKFPLNLPYQTAWAEYQRYDGEVEVSGTLYKYVKRKVSNDTLYVMCIPNTKKMDLEIAKDNYFKISNNISQNSNSKKSDNSKNSTVKNQQNEYDSYSISIHGFLMLGGGQQNWLPAQLQNTLAAVRTSPEQPPDVNFI
ncbi:MAG: hypothetical protein ABJB86_13835 [Bacteroidota bacterium]